MSIKNKPLIRFVLFLISTQTMAADLTLVPVSSVEPVSETLVALLKDALESLAQSAGISLNVNLDMPPPRQIAPHYGSRSYYMRTGTYSIRGHQVLFRGLESPVEQAVNAPRGVWVLPDQHIIGFRPGRVYGDHVVELIDVGFSEFMSPDPGNLDRRAIYLYRARQNNQQINVPFGGLLTDGSRGVHNRRMLANIILQWAQGLSESDRAQIEFYRDYGFARPSMPGVVNLLTRAAPTRSNILTGVFAVGVAITSFLAGRNSVDCNAGAGRLIQGG